MISHVSSHSTPFSTKHTVDVHLATRLLRAGKVEFAFLCFCHRAMHRGFEEVQEVAHSAFHLGPEAICAVDVQDEVHRSITKD